MLTRTVSIAALSVLLALTVGCSQLTMAQRRQAQLQARKIARLSAGTTGHIDARNIEAAMAATAPSLSLRQRARLRRQFEQTTILKRYRGCRVDIDSLAEKLPSSRVLSGKVKAQVPMGNPRGQRWKDTYDFTREEEQWYVQAVDLVAPRRGDAVSLPHDEHEQVRRILQQLIEHLRKGRTTAVMQMLPDTQRAHYRAGRGGLLDRLLGRAGRPFHVWEDVERLSHFRILRWPQLQNGIPLAYVGPVNVMACFDIPYAWPGGGVYDDVLRLEVMLRKAEDGWEIRFLRLFGKAIENSP